MFQETVWQAMRIVRLMYDFRFCLFPGTDLVPVAEVAFVPQPVGESVDFEGWSADELGNVMNVSNVDKMLKAGVRPSTAAK
jgi:hypothetical protein